MGIQSWSDDVILGDLQREPQLGDELKTVIDLVNDRHDCDVILDFSNVDIITSPSLSKLLKLRQALADCGHRLVICSIRELTRGAFKVTGLDGFFELAADRSAASQELGVKVSQ
ncbi:MAG: STAS domain-containing protein [Planctomycetota bacterium]|jgi:anti-anti-sigma factor